jgi:hypothetical protein
MRIAVQRTDLYVLNMRARMPFRYGIASLTALPHLFVCATLDIDGTPCPGIASDGLPPKWFTKDPATSFQDDLADMLRVIENACRLARQAGSAPSIFDLWQRIYAAQEEWARRMGYPPLLWGFGVSLIERAIIDAFCRATGTPFGQALRANTLGIRLSALYPELEGTRPADFLPDTPLRSIIVRHTVGLADPLTEDEILPAERLDDGLPQSLEACIRAYGLTHFKLKVRGTLDADLERLERIAAVLEETRTEAYAFTLDCNEAYTSVEAFRMFWEALARRPGLAGFVRHLLYVEQPFHRDVALSAQVAEELLAWPDRPPIIIDESDATPACVPAALAAGYAGTSHKNCKGVLRSVAAACLLAHRRRHDSGRPYILSGEDLANVGPVALLQDLAVAASLGLAHVERNGHHYFRGLSMYPLELQAQVLACHSDLYRRHERSFPTLDIRSGRIRIDSVVDAPFGLAFLPDVSQFTPLDAWSFASLEATGP